MKLLAVLLLVLPLQAEQPKAKVPPPQQTVIQQPAAVPRYQLIQLGDARQDQYLLDTVTGRTWQMVVSKEGERLWQRVMFTHGPSLFRAEIPEPLAEIEADILARKEFIRKLDAQPAPVK